MRAQQQQQQGQQGGSDDVDIIQLQADGQGLHTMAQQLAAQQQQVRLAISSVLTDHLGTRCLITNSSDDKRQ